MSPLQGSPLSRRIVEPTINEMFGPNTKPSRELMGRFHQILEYNDGKRVLHKVGRFLERSLRPPQSLGARDASNLRCRCD